MSDDKDTSAVEQKVLVSEFWQEKYRKEAGKSWNLFYKRNSTNFFKDRHWVTREFPETLQVSSLLEIGCGVGNFILPLLEDRKEARGDAWEDDRLYACDVAPTAIELLRADPRYQEPQLTAFVNNICQEDVALDVTVDCVALIFVLSAIPPESHDVVFTRIRKMLKPGGLLLFRDYAEDDAAQRRFKPDRYLGGKLWVRQDGTFAYYFAIEELIALAARHGLLPVDIQLKERETVNEKKGIALERKFIQAKFQLSPI